MVGAGAWAHVALPLVVSPPVELPSLQPAQPKGSPLVSVLIPSGGFHKPIGGRDTMLLRHCLTCLLQRSDYRELEIVLIDGGELSREELAEFEKMTAYGLGPGRWRHARSDLPYSYSQRINQAAAAARGEFLLQLNDDTELLELLSGDGDLPSDQVEEDCLKGDLRSLLGQLPHLQEQVLRMRYGMDGEDPMSLTGIGRILGMSRDRVRNLERDGLAGLRRVSDQVEAYVAC